MIYPESVRYLYSLGNELKPGAKFSLDRIQTLLAELGHPEIGPRFIHVAGTNGKGSTSAMIASCLAGSGFATGLYTSPHLIEPTERIRLNGVDSSAEDFAQSFAVVHRAAQRLLDLGRIDDHPSYFETVTAMALEIFHRRATTAVIEVGLGGRLDATNVITPELSVITPVSYDHEAFLGNTLESIAAEKAGILKPGVPVVMGPQPLAAESVIAARAHALDCELIRVSDVPYQIERLDAYGSAFSVDSSCFECPLAGRHQIENAVAAVLACQRLGLAASDIQTGLRATVWPGRLERVSSQPEIVLDGAHNPSGASALARYIREFYADRPVWLVYGAMRDKAIEEVTETLFPLAAKLILTAPDFPRALRPEAILEVTPSPDAVLTSDVPAAIREALAAPPEVVTFFAGSLYLVGEARRLFRKMNAE